MLILKDVNVQLNLFKLYIYAVMPALKCIFRLAAQYLPKSSSSLALECSHLIIRFLISYVL